MKKKYEKDMKSLQKHLNWKFDCLSHAWEYHGFKIYMAIIISIAYVMGRWPNYYFYILFCAIIPLLLLERLVLWIQMKSQFFMMDFCYICSALIVVYITCYPKNELLYRAVFLISNGTLGVSVVLFKNKCVLNVSEYITSLFLHIFPVILMYNLRQVTMPYEATLPEAQRWFT